jgi:hypothetical protein
MIALSHILLDKVSLMLYRKRFAWESGATAADLLFRLAFIRPKYISGVLTELYQFNKYLKKLT